MGQARAGNFPRANCRKALISVFFGPHLFLLTAARAAVILNLC